MNQDNDIIIELSEPQTEVLSTRKAVILDMAGQGGGKSRVIGYSSASFILEFPELMGFIGANTEMQLTQSTLSAVFRVWADVYGLYEYDQKASPSGAFVVDKRPPPHFSRIHKQRSYRGIISFWNGCTVYIGSLENYKAHDGKEFAWAHLDETKDTKEAALKEVIFGRLRQYGLWYSRTSPEEIYFDSDISKENAEKNNWESWNPLYIHTSPAMGGVPWLNKMFNLDPFAKEIKRRVSRKEKDYFKREFENKCVVIYSAYHNQQNLPPNYLKNQESNLATEEDVLKMVHGYPFGKSGSSYYPSFRKDFFVHRVPYRRGKPVHITLDFNVMPYMTLLCAHVEFITRYISPDGIKRDTPEYGDQPIEVLRISFYREYCLGSPQNSVEGVAEAFMADHDPTETEVFFYGDASGLSRIPGLGSYTNFGQLKDLLFAYLNSNSQRVKMPNVAPLTRRDLLQKIFAGKIPEVEVEFDESMEKTIDDFEYVKQGVNGKVKEKEEDKETKKFYEKNGHTSDAAEYMVCWICAQYLTSA